MILLIFVAVVLLILFLFWKKQPLKYKKIENLCTSAEYKFYKILHEAVGDRFLIFSKVRAADVLVPVKSKDRSRWRSAFNKVACKHFDFVLCDEELQIIAAIELDDASHSKKERIERDRFLEWACKSANLPLVRIKTAKRYDPKKLQEEILRSLR